jgi:cytochrome bd-type quinol oxidase subunit 1
VFVAIYAALGAADLVLMLRYSRKGLDHEDEAENESKGAAAGTGAIPALTY